MSEDSTSSSQAVALRSDDPEGMVKQVQELISQGDGQALDDYLKNITASDRALVVTRLDADGERRLFQAVSCEVASWLFLEVPENNLHRALDCLPPEKIATVLDELRSDQQADMLSVVSLEKSELILRNMKSTGADQLRDLLAFAPNTAAGLMVTEFLQYRVDLTTGEILDDLRKHGSRYSDYEVQYAYIVEKDRRLTGVLRMRDLLFSEPSTPIRTLMLSNPASVRGDAALDELVDFFDDHGFFGAPVVDSQGRMLGVIRRSAVQEESAKEANQILMKLAGIVGGEEYRSMSLWSRSGRRLSFLSINIVLNVVAASVIAFFTDTLEAVIALAVFLPIISDMSGCSGNQAVAVSIRELALGLVRPVEFFRVLIKESAVGILNGVALGILIGLVAFLWKGNMVLGLVVGAAMAMNTLVAVCVGGLVPLLVRRLRLDPALVSGPVLTTVTDMCGFFFVLGLATLFLEYLV